MTALATKTLLVRVGNRLLKSGILVRQKPSLFFVQVCVIWDSEWADGDTFKTLYITATKATFVMQQQTSQRHHFAHYSATSLQN